MPKISGVILYRAVVPIVHILAVLHLVVGVCVYVVLFHLILGSYSVIM